MRNLKRAFWGILLAAALLWALADPAALQPAGFFVLRAAMLQLTGVVAIACMSVAMLLALRPRWPERWLGGLDKMYRLHKWLGIAALAAGVLHWLWAQGPRWAVDWRWLQRPARGPRPAPDHPLEAFLGDLRWLAESVGEWAFYAMVVLIALALIRLFPYRLFYKTHRLLAVAYLALAFHTVVLFRFDYWPSPLGLLTAVLLAGGTWAAAVVLLRRVAAGRRVVGRIASLRHYPGVRSLEIAVEVPAGWPGHQPGQFAFATSDADEGPHPYTIASTWDPQEPRITFIAKELGDHTRRLRERLRVGQEVGVEGPYGCFTFDDDCRLQIWIGGGIGITPFVGRMKQLAQRDRTAGEPGPTVHLFHSTAEVDEDALARLAADAGAAEVRLHVLVDARDGLLTGERIRAAVPDWHEASIWFCGPPGFGDAIRRDFAARGFPVDRRFHQELFEMR